MVSFSGLGIGLSFVFGFVFLGIVAEIYHLVWWKKKKKRENIRRGKEISTLFSCNNPNSVEIEKTQEMANSVEIPDPNGPEPGPKGFGEEATEIYHLLWWKKKKRESIRRGKEISTLFCCNNPNSVEIEKTQEIAISVENPDPNGPEPDLESGPKGFGEEESAESELKRLHNLCGPPRFLFTIKEETKEDLESDDGKSRRGDRSRKGSRTRSFSDLVFAIDTPLASPKGNSYQFESCEIHGFNPLFESFSEADIDRLMSSPPPKLKFLRDAEEKLMMRLREAAGRRAIEERESSFIRIIVGKNRENEHHHQQLPQVLPLA